MRAERAKRKREQERKERKEEEILSVHIDDAQFVLLTGFVGVRPFLYE
jgi:hypothetical protein